MYLKRDAAAEWKEWERRTVVVTESVTKIGAVTTEIYIPQIANHVPHIRIKWEKAKLNLTADDVRKQLREGKPSIEIVPGSSPAKEEKQEISIGVWQMQPGEAEVIAKRLREVFKIV